MRAISGKDFTRLLERRGWTLLRINGSHHIYGRPGNQARLSVPVHGTRPLKIGLLRHLVKLASIEENDIL
jgi:predicted RNA binding protein YcfA (HicA-like mRNA interferase family)